MIRYKKIRGHKRIWKSIDFWVHHNKILDAAELKQRQRDYVKVWVPPFKNISITNSEFTPPQGKSRKKIIDGIFMIYHSWKKQLDSLNEPYYLKIWYFPHDVSKNQVVCAIGDFIDFYELTFYKPELSKPFPDHVRDLQWEYRHQEHHITERDLEESEMFSSQKDYIDHKKWVENIMKDPKARVNTYKNDDGTENTYYSLRECDLWTGG